jgi:hypothetical protein
MSLSIEEQARIRKAVAEIDDAEPAAAVRGKETELDRVWAEDMIVNAPSNQVAQIAATRELIRQRTGLQYTTYERHREATVVRRHCAVTMGYEVVVPKGNDPNAGRTITRRYTNVYALGDDGWQMIARHAANVSIT